MKASTAIIILAYTAGMAFAAPTPDASASKREAEPQRGRGGRAGGALKGVANGVSIISDGLAIGGALQNQKRDPQRGRGRGGSIGGALRGAADGVSIISDGLAIGGALQNQKRDPQRGRRPGNTAEVRPIPAETLREIKGAPQNQKRDPQRGSRPGNTAKLTGSTHELRPEAGLLEVALQNQKRDHRRIPDATGVANKIPPGFTIDGAVQNQKRDPQRGRGSRIGGALKGCGPCSIVQIRPQRTRSI